MLDDADDDGVDGVDAPGSGVGIGIFVPGQVAPGAEAPADVVLGSRKLRAGAIWLDCVSGNLKPGPPIKRAPSVLVALVLPDPPAAVTVDAPAK